MEPAKGETRMPEINHADGFNTIEEAREDARKIIAAGGKVLEGGLQRGGLYGYSFELDGFNLAMISDPLVYQVQRAGEAPTCYGDLIAPIG
jgi:hypothetical protein